MSKHYQILADELQKITIQIERCILTGDCKFMRGYQPPTSLNTSPLNEEVGDKHTLRETLMLKALDAIYEKSTDTLEAKIHSAYKIADLMITERNKP